MITEIRDVVAPAPVAVQPRETMRGLPGCLQPFLTWVTGVPLADEKPVIPWSPPKVAALGMFQTGAGIALGAYALAPLRWWSLPLLVLSWLITSGGMRRLDVLMIHQSLHGMVAKSSAANRVVGELLTTLLWRAPYDENRKEHLLHHAFPCSMKDIDTRYLISTGMRPGMSRAQFHRYLMKLTLSPSHHWGFFSGRMKSNFSRTTPPYRLAMSVAYLLATLAFLALTHQWVAWLVLWLVPVSFFFQNATVLYTLSEHRWWIFDHAEKLTMQQRDELTFGRLCGEPAPVGCGTAAWAAWWLRILFVHSPYRTFILVGDTVQHDLHHVRPKCDWANSPYERYADISQGSTRYSDVWGTIADHLYAAGDVRLN
jgi:fatty acid desaturase